MLVILARAPTPTSTLTLTLTLTLLPTRCLGAHAAALELLRVLGDVEKSAGAAQARYLVITPNPNPSPSREVRGRRAGTLPSYHPQP